MILKIALVLKAELTKLAEPDFLRVSLEGVKIKKEEKGISFRERK